MTVRLSELLKRNGDGWPRSTLRHLIGPRRVWARLERALFGFGSRRLVVVSDLLVMDQPISSALGQTQRLASVEPDANFTLTNRHSCDNQPVALGPEAAVDCRAVPLTAKERMAAARLHRNWLAIVLESALWKNGFWEKSHVQETRR
jgi:hypothetical protein